MTFDNHTTEPCVVNRDGCGNLVDSEACEDPLYAYDHQDECPNWSELTGMEVVPDDTEVEVGGVAHFRAYLTFANGQRKDVTDVAEWSSSNEAVATVEQVTGFVTGVTIGLSTVQAVYRAQYDFGQITVVEACVTVGLDFAMVFDRSGSMTAIGADGKSRMESSLVASKAMVANVDFSMDQVSVISFAGIWRELLNGSHERESDATVHTQLTTSESAVIAAIDAVRINQPCVLEDPVTHLHISRCATGIGGGLQAAYDELKSDRHIAGNSRVVVLLADGGENICDPDPQIVADQMKSEGFTIVVIALAVLPGDIGALCGSEMTEALDYLRALTTCDLFFEAPTVDDLPDIYAQIPKRICTAYNGDPCLYSYIGD